MKLTSALRAAALILGFVVLGNTAHAACTSPAGEAGSIAWASNISRMVYCDGTNWVQLGGGSGGGGGSDNLGNHTATQALDMGSFNINNAGTMYGTGAAVGGLTVTGNSNLNNVSATLLQVGNNGVACSSGISGSIRYSSVSSTMEYCNSTAWVSMGPSGTVSYMHKSFTSNQSGLAMGTVLAFSGVEASQGPDIVSNGNQMILGPGIYRLDVYVRTSGGANDILDYQIYDVTNNTAVGVPGSAGIVVGYSDVPAVAFVNLTTSRTYEVRIVGLAGTPVAVQHYSSFSATKLSGGGSGSGGGTANPAGSTADVQFNSGGNLAADTGVFTYASGLLKAPTISATTQVQAPSVSLTTAGTTWGYLASAASYLPTLRSTNISASSAIQIGSNSLTCNSGISGSIRYSSVSSTMEYCNSTAWVSMGPSATTVPAFSAFRTANQTVSANTWVKVQLSSENFDTQNNFDNATNYRFQPLVAGKYILTGQVECGSATGFCSAAIFKNGSLYLQGASYSTSSGAGAPVVAVVDMNGTTDFVELYGFTASTTFTGGSSQLQFSGSLIASGNGLLGGGGGVGASALSGLSDVQLTNLAGRDYLRYDNATSKWVNISESAVMSTTTMVPGFPDAILCSDGSNNFMLPMTNAYAGGGATYETIFTAAGGARYNVTYTSGGAYSGHTNLAGFDCVTGTKSIATLYAEGKAFNFIGNAATSSGALGDRITSGTLPYAVTVNSATGIISLSSGATTWGYLGSAASFLPSVATNKVSATAVSGSIIQVGSTGASCTSGISGSIRYSQVSSTLEYCNSVAWIGVTNSTDASLTAFTVTKASIQSLPTAGTVVTWEDVITNNGGAFNLSTERFVAPANGYYFFIASLLTDNDPSYGDFSIYKNSVNTGLRSYGTSGATSYKPITAQGVLYLATGDYVDVRSNLNSQSLTGGTGNSVSTFSGFLLNAGNGGAGSDNLGDHTATQNLAMGSYNIIGTGQISMTNVSTTALDVYGDVRVTGVVTDASDKRLKTDINPLPEALSQILRLNAVSFRMKDSKEQTELGFLAQDMQKVFPQLVFSDGPDGYLRMNYIGLLAPMVKAMQELNARFDLLQGMNDNLRRWNVEQNIKIDAVADDLQAVKKINAELQTIVSKKVVELDVYRVKTQELSRAIDELRNELRELKQANKK